MEHLAPSHIQTLGKRDSLLRFATKGQQTPQSGNVKASIRFKVSSNTAVLGAGEATPPPAAKSPLTDG